MYDLLPEELDKMKLNYVSQRNQGHAFTVLLYVTSGPSYRFLWFSGAKYRSCM